jgi:hypothetical protein
MAKLDSNIKYLDCLVIIAIIFIFTGCDLLAGVLKLEAPVEVRDRALENAREYMKLSAEYEWGGQDPLPRTIVVDCSGLVIRCYQYACEDFGYRLLFNDTTSYGLLNYTIELSQDTLTPGDLLFIGDGGVVSHVALFVDNDGTNIIFIDSTYKPEEDINGVSKRYYAKNDPRFICYGRMVIIQ